MPNMPDVMIERAIAVVHPAFTEYLADLCKTDFARTEDELTRPVCITPYTGSYGLAGYAILVNGSPPHAAVYITREEILLCNGKRTRSIFPHPYREPFSHIANRLIRFLVNAGVEVPDHFLA